MQALLVLMPRAREADLRLVVGCRLDLRDAPSMLLTIGKGRAGKEGCDLAWADLVALGEGLLLIVLPDAADERLLDDLRRMRRAFGDRCYVALTRRMRPGDQVRLLHA